MKVNNAQKKMFRNQPSFLPARGREPKVRKQAGFTLLELVIVLTIIVILASIGVMNYQMLQAHARETVLKQDLHEMRKAIDQYAADKEQLPQSLDDLVTSGYIREIPTDPISTQKDWKVDMDEDTISRTGGQGVVDGHSASAGAGAT